VAGIFLGTSEGELQEPLARNAAEFCRLAGAPEGSEQNGLLAQHGTSELDAEAC
jgi:hypothetical protein